MSEQPQLISIDGKSYLIDDLSDNCKELLGAAQQSNQAIGLIGALINAAQKGADLNMKEAMKLLPEPYEAEELEGELASKAH